MTRNIPTWAWFLLFLIGGSLILARLEPKDGNGNGNGNGATILPAVNGNGLRDRHEFLAGADPYELDELQRRRVTI